MRLISDVGEKVTSPDLTDGGRRDTQNGAYFNFSHPDVAANKQVRLSMTGLPERRRRRRRQRRCRRTGRGGNRRGWHSTGASSSA